MCYDFVSNDSTMIVVGDFGKIAVSSTTNLNWNFCDSINRLTINTPITSIIHDGSKFILGEKYGNITTSIDGYNWTPLVQINQYITQIAYGNSIYVVVGENTISTSTDLNIWTRSIPELNFPTFSGIIFSPALNKFLAYNKQVAMSSTDGLTWIPENLQNITSVCVTSDGFACTMFNETTTNLTLIKG